MLKGSGVGQTASKWTGELLRSIAFSPNQITLWALIFALLGAGALALREFWLSLTFLAISAFCDVADGAVARVRGQANAKGAFLDGVTDRFVEFLMLVGLMAVPLPAFILPGAGWAVLALFLGSTMTAFIPAYADHRGLKTARPAPEGLFPRPERLLSYFLVVALLGLRMDTLALFALMGSVLLSALTVAERMLFYWHNAE